MFFHPNRESRLRPASPIRGGREIEKLRSRGAIARRHNLFEQVGRAIQNIYYRPYILTLLRCVS
jgi:hypothetical protein